MTVGAADHAPDSASAATHAGAAPALRVEDVHFSYPGKRPGRRGDKRGEKRDEQRGDQLGGEVLKGVNFNIPAGQTVALLGPNGSGKSTLIRIISSMLRADAGRVEVFGRANAEDIRRALGVVFQTPGLDRHMTARENLRDQAVLYGIDRASAAKRVDDALKRAGLTERAGALVRTLSGGMARRLDLCRALMHEPNLLILDEPTVGLDPAAREAFLNDLFVQQRETELTLLMSTHLVDEADRCDRVVLMHHGDIIADDTPAALRARVGSHRITLLDKHIDPPTFDHVAWRQTSHGWAADIAGQDTAGAEQTIAHQLTADGIAFSFAPPSLADVFEELTGATLVESEVEEVST